MIIDSHCHAWRKWPYQPPVPDPDSRGLAEQLLFEMDQAGVDRAAVVCARIGGNDDNNDYIADAVRAHSDRLYQFADVDCSWTETYHKPGAAERLRDAIERYQLKGFTHYVRPEDDGSWFLSDEGHTFFTVAADHKQIVSLSIAPRLQSVLRAVAQRFQSLTFLCHHMAAARVSSSLQDVQEILDSAREPNIHVKLSGFHHASTRNWDFPYADCQPLARQLYEHFGARRLHWGSDYPVVRRGMTYRQSLEAIRYHCTFIPEADMALVLGDSLADILASAGR